MTEIPSMKFYPDAYLADTMHLTLEEHGAYLKLLFCMWRSGGELPNDDVKLARILGVTIAKWKKLRTVLSEFFEENSGKIFQKRLKKDYADALEKKYKLADNGSAGGRAKSLKNKNSSLANATDLPGDLLEQIPSKAPSKNVASRAETHYHNHNITSDTNVSSVIIPPPPPARARGEPVKNLEDLKTEHVETFLLQRRMAGREITLDVEEQLARFKAEFSSWGGRHDSRGNGVADWRGKFERWLLEENGRIPLKPRGSSAWNKVVKGAQSPPGSVDYSRLREEMINEGGWNEDS